MRRLISICLASVLSVAPLGAEAADLVVWWEEGWYPQEDQAVREIIAAFEQKTGKRVELDQPSHDDIRAEAQAAVRAGEPPDFLFGLRWEAFCSFWCDRVQPAVRRATGRGDVWGVGLAMSAEGDTRIQFEQFIQAYQANYVTREGKLVIDDPEIRRRLITTIDSYTAIYRKGCTPPDSVTWADIDNSQAFLTGAVVMVANDTLSVPNALKAERPEDYYENTATIEWPDGADGQPLAIRTFPLAATAFKAGGHVALAKELVRFLVGEGWLAHYLNFSGERMLPSMPKLLDAPFWLDPSDRHHMASAIQFLTRPRDYKYWVASGNPRHLLVLRERVWAKAVHRVAAESISPAQAVDDAIARIKQILSELLELSTSRLRVREQRPGPVLAEAVEELG